MGSGLLTPGHLVILAVIALLVFGPKRLPELGRSLGRGMRGFKEAIEGHDDDDEHADAPPAAQGLKPGSGAEVRAPAATTGAEPAAPQPPAPRPSP